MPKVELQPAGRERRDTIANLFQLYIHDFTEQWFDRPQGELGEDGLFEPYSLLDNYWSEPGHEAMLIRADGHLAGFVLVNKESHSGEPVDFQVAEYFVARKHRRSGVGQTAALQLLNARPGRWELAVARRNVGAQHFWRRVAAAIAGGAVNELDLDDERWNGIILRFRAGPAPG
jgi:predicted acetyltransferase